MKIQTRKRIFYVFLLLFIVIGIFVVMYAEGWRLNWTTLETEKAGGIYVHSFPDGAQITLNGKPIQNQSAFLSRGTFISGLFPKTYTLALAEPGYDAWTENAQVVPSIVTEMKYAVLVPKMALNVATNTATVTDFFEAGGNVVTISASGTIFLQGKVIGHGAIVSHSTDLKTAIIRSVNVKTGAATYSLYDFSAATSTAIKPPASSNIFIDPFNDTSILEQTPAQIVSIDADTHRATTIDTAPAGQKIESSIAVSGSEMAWAHMIPAVPGASSTASTATSQIIVYDKFSGDTIDSSLTLAGPVKQLAWVKNNVLGILASDNTLYLYNVSNERLTTLADDVKQFYPTTDGASIAALEYNSLEVFSFTTSDYYRFALPQVADVQGLTWYKDETHLFVQYPNRVAFLDLADTNLKNLITVSEGTDAAYDQQENALYLIDQGQKLLRFDFPQ